MFDCLHSLQSIRPWEEVSVPTRRRDEALALHKAADRERRGQTNQRRLTQLMKKKIAARDRWTCRRCKKTVDHTYEIDHIHPRSRGGSDAPANLRLLCRACHGYICGAATRLEVSPCALGATTRQALPLNKQLVSAPSSSKKRQPHVVGSAVPRSAQIARVSCCASLAVTAVSRLLTKAPCHPARVYVL